MSTTSHNVFVYGTLLADGVLFALLKRVPRSCPAILSGYIKGRVYPAILPVADKQVDGKQNSEKIQVLAYIWGHKDDPGLHGDWNFEVMKSAPQATGTQSAKVGASERPRRHAFMGHG